MSTMRSVVLKVQNLIVAFMILGALFVSCGDAYIMIRVIRFGISRLIIMEILTPLSNDLIFCATLIQPIRKKVFPSFSLVKYFSGLTKQKETLSILGIL